MEYITGVALALGICFLATAVGLDRDRAFYPTLMIVIASYYGLFAVIGGSLHVLTLELVGIGAFALLSVVGFRITLWWVVGALVAHGVFDWFHGRLIADPGVPSWWPMFCLTYDVVGRRASANPRSLSPSCSALSALRSSRRPVWYPKEIQAGET